MHLFGFKQLKTLLGNRTKTPSKSGVLTQTVVLACWLRSDIKLIANLGLNYATTEHLETSCTRFNPTYFISDFVAVDIWYNVKEESWLSGFNRIRFGRNAGVDRFQQCCKGFANLIARKQRFKDAKDETFGVILILTLNVLVHVDQRHHFFEQGLIQFESKRFH